MVQFTTMLINFLLFHFCWMGTAFGAANGLPYLGPLLVVGSLAIHLILISRPGREVLFLITVGMLGFLLDTLLYRIGLYKFPVGQALFVFPPPWLLAQWMIFGSLFHCSLVWLRGRYGLAAFLGGVLGPFSYYSAAVLDAIIVTSPNLQFLAFMALVWGGTMPLLTWMAHESPWFGEVRMAGYWTLSE